MPLNIGPDAHRSAVAEAVFRIIDGDGVSAATVTRVAHETGLPPATVAAYFTNSAELLTFVREVIYSRQTQRLDRPAARIRDTGPSVTAAERLAAIEDALTQLLPMDEERRKETRVWLALSVHAADHPDLEPLSHVFSRSIREGLRNLFTSGKSTGVFAPDLDIPVEGERLAALLSGLRIDALLHPELVRPRTMRAVLRRHLADLSAVDRR
ncbi:TetR/AcrR family transcriptional regulator [Marinactinospora rubrisoli]|uniref:TetR/AcrR family transcriptional regulator n=1 Tax=Marinactinospora rubrisoli TaxID=2715399 RepID=A0ABW2KF05_9ACTN